MTDSIEIGNIYHITCTDDHADLVGIHPYSVIYTLAQIGATYAIVTGTRKSVISNVILFELRFFPDNAYCALSLAEIYALEKCRFLTKNVCNQ